MYHSDVTCTPSQRCCSKCRGQDHLSYVCKAHFTKYHCVNCDEWGHGAFDKSRFKILKEIEKESTTEEMRRLRMDAGKPATSKRTDAKSYSSVANSNLTLAFKGELNAIANQNASLERKLHKKSNKLLKEFRRMATCQEARGQKRHEIPRF